ncbi:MAG TPA: hypothetical protein VJ826_15045, partial [Candidatus Polarisedimenticolaceae bacterium]|nr:hypothetical protein [Candidatus Polarisedimenticolaceae bacterium]
MGRRLTRDQREDQARRLVALRRADPVLATLPEKTRREIERLMLEADEPLLGSAVDPGTIEDG